MLYSIIAGHVIRVKAHQSMTELLHLIGILHVVNRKWLYTTITRATDLSKVFFYGGEAQALMLRF